MDRCNLCGQWDCTCCHACGNTGCEFCHGSEIIEYNKAMEELMQDLFELRREEDREEDMRKLLRMRGEDDE